MRISDKISLLRKRRGLSQEQLAKSIGVSRQAIYKWEAGITTPDIDNVKVISEFFGISLNDLVDDNVNISETPITITKEENIDTPTDILQGDTAIKNKNRIGLFALIGTLSLAIVVLSIVLIVSLSKHTHSFGGYTIEIQPTCTVAGIERRYCECGESEARSISTISHSEIIIDGYAPTCSQIGITEGKKCSICNTVLKEQTIIPIDSEKHIEEIIKGTPANCISEGLTDGIKCTECGITLKKQEVIPLDGHSEEIIKGYNATCIRDGLTDGKKCLVCDVVLLEQEIIKSNGQHIEKIIEGYPSTCIKNGLSDKVVCSECNEVLVNAVSLPLGKCTESDILGYEATCTSVGLTTGKVCSNCGKALVKQEIIRTQEHNFVNDCCTYCGNLKGINEKISYLLNEDKCSYTAYAEGDINIDKLIIPSTYEGFPVTKIGNFSSITSVDKIHLPNTITEIKDGAFSGVSSVYDITLPNSLTSIGKNAFNGTAIKSFTIPKNVDSIGENAFASSKIRYITFADGTEEIDASAFSSCSTIKAIYIPSSVKNINGAICGGSENAVIYRNTKADTSNWSSAWESCKDNQKCTVYVVNECPESFIPFTYTINSDGKSYTITGNENTIDEEIIVIPSTYSGYPVTYIDAIAFQEHSTVREVYIPDTVKSIGRYAFFKCSSLTYVDFGKGLVEIQNRAFMQANLKEINLPKSINYIDTCAFAYCTSVSKITLEDGCSAYKLIDGVLYSKDGALLVLYPNASTQASYNIPEGVAVIHGGAFCGSVNLTSVTLPSTLKVIGELSFQNCESIQSIVLPNGLTTIGSFAFANCPALESVIIPTSVTTIKDGAFSVGSTICHIYYMGESIPDSWEVYFSWYVSVYFNIKKIGATENGLKYVITNDNEVTITSGANSDGNVPSLIEGYPVTVIGKNAFYGYGKSSIELTNTIKRIEDYAFSGSSLTKMILPSGVEYLGTYLFSACKKLSNIYIPNTVKEISGPLMLRKDSNLHIYYQIGADITLWDEYWNKYNGFGDSYYEYITMAVADSTDL